MQKDEANREAKMIEEQTEQRERIDKAVTSIAHDDLGTLRCPKCEGPMVARLGRQGSYFHCKCYEAKVHFVGAGINNVLPRLEGEHVAVVRGTCGYSYSSGPISRGA